MNGMGILKSFLMKRSHFEQVRELDISSLKQPEIKQILHSGFKNQNQIKY